MVVIISSNGQATGLMKGQVMKQIPELIKPPLSAQGTALPESGNPWRERTDTPQRVARSPALRAAIALLQNLRATDPEFPIQYALCLAEIACRADLSITELAHRTQISLSTVSRIVSALSNPKGRYGPLVDVRLSRVESRRKELSLTPTGRHFISNMTKGYANFRPF